MSRHRISPDAGFIDPKNLPRGPFGKPLCRQCHHEVPKRKRSFCGEKCVTRWKIKTQPSFARAQVFKRDHGVCKLCGLDTDRLRKELSQLKVDDYIAYVQEIHTLKVPATRKTLWDADHVIPVNEGGGESDLDNYRTLCFWCHKDITARYNSALQKKKHETIL